MELLLNRINDFNQRGGFEEGKELSIEKWRDWKWQINHTITTVEMAEKLLAINFSQEKREQIRRTIEKFPMRITPYYLINVLIILD